MNEVIYSILTDPLMQVAYWVTGAFVLLLVIGFVVVNRIYNRKVERGELPKVSGKSPYNTFRDNQKAKALAIAVAVVAVAGAAQSANAQTGFDGAHSQFYGGYGSESAGNFWSWFTGLFTTADIVQGITTMNQNPSQALPNNFAYGLQQAETNLYRQQAGLDKPRNIGGLTTGRGRFGPINQ